MITFQTALAAYLADAENAETRLANAVGISQAAINRYRHGKRFPTSDIARRIEEATAGAVPYSAWHSDFLSRAGVAA